MWDVYLFSADYTAQEYFKRKGESRFVSARTDIAITCLTYLSFDTFGPGRCDNYGTLLADNPFLDYAARHWGDHVRGQEETIKGLALGFLQDSPKAACAGDVLTAKSWERPNYSGMHLSSLFGLEKLIDYQLKTGAIADSKSRDGRSPLSIAAQHGHEAVVRRLLMRDDVDINSKDSIDETPLSWAAMYGDETVVKLFLARDDVDVDSKGLRGQTPLSWAAENGHEAVVKLFLARHDVNADSKDLDGRTPLLWAARSGHEAVVRLFLARDDVNVDSKDLDGRTPLLWAARSGHEAVVRLFLARDDVDVNSTDSGGQTPLWWATEYRREAVVKLLLAQDGVDVNLKNPYSHWYRADN